VKGGEPGAIRHRFIRRVAHRFGFVQEYLLFGQRGLVIPGLGEFNGVVLQLPGIGIPVSGLLEGC